MGPFWAGTLIPAVLEPRRLQGYSSLKLTSLGALPTEQHESEEEECLPAPERSSAIEEGNKDEANIGGLVKVIAGEGKVYLVLPSSNAEQEDSVVVKQKNKFSAKSLHLHMSGCNNSDDLPPVERTDVSTSSNQKLARFRYI